MRLRRRLAALEGTAARRRAVAIDPALQAELEALSLDELRARREALLNDASDPRTAALVARRRALLHTGRAA
jgi:hypothetical protein